LEARQAIQEKRKRVWNFYFEALQDWAEEIGARLPVVPPGCQQAYHMFYVVLPSGDYRDGIISHLKARGMLSVFHYVPLHSSLAGKKFGAHSSECPVAEDVSARLLRLPFYNDIAAGEQQRVLSALTSYRHVQGIRAV
jgi:dTDP-4-amino-4,6-dideoxygalactose transaminase